MRPWRKIRRDTGADSRMTQSRVPDRRNTGLDWLAGIDIARFAEIVAAAADLAVVMTGDGTVLEFTVGPDMPLPRALGLETGRSLHEALTEESRPKLDALLQQGLAGEAPFGRELNHRDTGQGEVPVRYTAVRGARAGEILLLGRDLRAIGQLQSRLINAQLALEEDYDRFRAIEGRYRVVMESVPFALVILSADQQTIVDANGATTRLFRRDAPGLPGEVFTALFSHEDQRAVTGALASVRSSGQAVTFSARMRSGGAVSVSASLFRAAASTLLLCRITPLSGEGAPADLVEGALPALFRQGGDAIVFTDPRGRILRANDSFLSLAGAALEDSLRGESLETYLGRAGVDLSVMIGKATEQGRMKLYATTLRSRFGAICPVEISVTHLAETNAGGFAFVIRDTSRAPVARAAVPPVSRQSVEHVMDLVGTAPLRELVRSTTDVVERMCIEAALELTGNNRASAAEMLGLSRQSLYVKLRKFGMIGGDEDEVADPS